MNSLSSPSSTPSKRSFSKKKSYFEQRIKEEGIAASKTRPNRQPLSELPTSTNNTNNIAITINKENNFAPTTGKQISNPSSFPAQEASPAFHSLVVAEREVLSECAADFDEVTPSDHLIADVTLDSDSESRVDSRVEVVVSTLNAESCGIQEELPQNPLLEGGGGSMSSSHKIQTYTGIFGVVEMIASTLGSVSLMAFRFFFRRSSKRSI